jgi:NAD(P)H dehydrogenase (quinone)
VTAAGPRGARQVPFAVSGATGALGGRVAARLADLGHGQRLIVRDKNRAPDLPGAEAAEASYEDPGAMRQALAGARTFFMVSASETHDRVRQHIPAVDAAVAAGVERIVYLSFLGAGPQATFTFARHHWWTEEHVRATGLRHTFLRDSLYLDLLPVFTRTDGVIRGPAGDGRVAAVARDDIADVAVAVLLDDGHDGRTYDVTGPEAITLHQVAEELSRFTGRPVTYHAETLEEAYASRASYGAPEWEVEGWVTSYVAIATGEMNVVSDTVSRLTGPRADDARRLPAPAPRELPTSAPHLKGVRAKIHPGFIAALYARTDGVLGERSKANDAAAQKVSRRTRYERMAQEALRGGRARAHHGSASSCGGDEGGSCYRQFSLRVAGALGYGSPTPREFEPEGTQKERTEDDRAVWRRVVEDQQNAA